MRLLAVISSFGLQLSKVHSRCCTDRQRLKRLRRRLTRPPVVVMLSHIQSDSYSINYNEDIKINIHIRLRKIDHHALKNEN